MNKQDARLVRLKALKAQEQGLEAEMLKLNDLVQRINILIIKSDLGSVLLKSFQARRADITTELHEHRKVMDSIRFEKEQLIAQIRGKGEHDGRLTCR